MFHKIYNATKDHKSMKDLGENLADRFERRFAPKWKSEL